MTDSEFGTWIKLHKAAFPEVCQWLSDNEDANAALDMWRTALRPISLESAKNVTAKCLSGRIEHPDRFGCSKLPGLILSHAPKRLPTVEEVNDPKNGWTPYRGMGR